MKGERKGCERRSRQFRLYSAKAWNRRGVYFSSRKSPTLWRGGEGERKWRTKLTKSVETKRVTYATKRSRCGYTWTVVNGVCRRFYAYVGDVFPLRIPKSRVNTTSPSYMGRRRWKLETRTLAGETRGILFSRCYRTLAEWNAR